MKSFDPPVIGNLGRLKARRQKPIVRAMVDALEQRVLLSGTGTLTSIAAFNGVNGYNPNSGVADAKGDIFGVTLATTDDGGNTFGPAVVFEIPAGTSTINDLATLTGAGTSVIVDSSGDVFGLESGATANTPGTVFEIMAGTSTLTTLASSAELASEGTVTAVDSAGDVFGLANEAPFEIKIGSGAVTPLENQNNPQMTFSDLLLGPDGNLYGIATDQNLDNVVADIAPSTGDITTLATIDPTTIGTFPQGMAFDSSGKIWGLCQYGGSAGQGTIWDLPAGGNTVSLVASFTAATGDTPVGPPVFDASGNLYGLTENDGANGDGTLFEIPAGAASAGPVDLVDLNDTEQVSTAAGFVTNSAGIAPSIDGDTIAGFGGLFSLSAAASAATGDVHPDDLGLLDGDFWAFFHNTHKAPPSDKDFDDADSDEFNELRHELALAHSHGGGTGQQEREAGARSVYEDQAPSLIKRDAPGSALVQATPEAKLSAPLEQIQQSLSTCGKELHAVAPLVSKQTSLTTQFNKEGTTIAGLEIKLAAQTKASSEAKIQTEITADTAAQTKILNEDDSVYSTAITQLTAIETLETSIQTALNAVSS